MKNLALAAFIASIFVSPLSHATEDSGPSRPSLGALQRIIESRSPETTVATPDHDRITADVAGGMAVLALDHPAMDAMVHQVWY
ncbi:hypothetical protein [Stenotrophomonas rhizophila]